MLYPKEDEDSHKLQYTCRTCQYTEEATSTCVFRNVLNNAAGETAGVTQDVGMDPTVGSPSGSRSFSGSGVGVPVFCLCCSKQIMCGKCEDEPALYYPPDVENPESPSFDTKGVHCTIDYRLDGLPDYEIEYSDLSDEYDWENGMDTGNDGPDDVHQIPLCA